MSKDQTPIRVSLSVFVSFCRFINKMHAELSEPKTDDEITRLLDEAFNVALPLLQQDEKWIKHESKIPHVTEFVLEDHHHLPYKGGSLPLIKSRGPVASIKDLGEVGALLLHGEKEDWEADEDLDALEVERDIGTHAKVVYKRFRSPTPISDRELENGGQLFVDRSINYPSRPVHGGCVRGSIVLSATLIEPTKKDNFFQVTFLSWLDMKGLLPATMISMYRHKTAERIDLYRFVFSGKTLDDDSE